MPDPDVTWAKTLTPMAPGPEDLWVMLLSTIRYSLGRQTYMTSFAPELVLKYSYHLTVNQLLQVAREIQEYLDLHGEKAKDREGWEKAVRDIKKRADDKYWLLGKTDVIG